MGAAPVVLNHFGDTNYPRKLVEALMTYPVLPEAAEVAGRFVKALAAARRVDDPFRRWLVAGALPETMCTGILTMPIAPPVVAAHATGERAAYNNQRCFFTPGLRKLFPAAGLLAEALQRPDVARQFEDTCGVKASGAYLRIEYIQDLNGLWLEPHRDIPEKLFSMVLYLCTGPYAKDWGTDLYDNERKWIARGDADFNSAVIFVAGPNTWHGFEPRPIYGVRRLLEINYVRDWRDRDQLAYPEEPIVAGERADWTFRAGAA
jgi:hypothetical protein